MSRSLVLYCPFCGEELEVTPADVERSGGEVRCGACLQLFDVRGGEPEFVAPRIDESGGAAALARFEIAPLQDADEPEESARVPWLWLVMAGLLIIALGWQINATLGHRAAGMTKVTLDQVVVRPHPERDNALQLDAILRNSSADPQPLPALELSFQDGFGTTRAARRFLPVEYLQGTLRGRRDIPPRSELQVLLELSDPGEETVNFSARLSPARKSSF